MPFSARGKTKENLVFVAINDFLYFGFKSKNLSSLPGISASDISALGHLQISGVSDGKIRILGASAPKPPKVSKKIENATPGQQQSVSTYCGYDSLIDAEVVGWRLIKGRQLVALKAVNDFRGSLTAIAKLTDGSLYCFPMNRDDFASYGLELGLKSALDITTESQRKQLVSGASIPYPGRASKILSVKSRFSSFFSSANQTDIAALGYDILSEERIIDSGTVPFFR